MNDLIANIEKLHTIKQADIIIGQGKNWYAYGKGVTITINAHSNTIITAHKINAKVRTMEKSDFISVLDMK